MAVGMVLGILATVLLVGLAAYYAGKGVSWARTISDAILVVLAFGPSLAVIPPGVAALLAVLAVRPFLRRASCADDQPVRADGVRLAWRISWMTFLAATLLSGLGYLVMLVDVLFGGHLISAAAQLF
jgi:hypothetical protein